MQLNYDGFRKFQDHLSRTEIFAKLKASDSYEGYDDEEEEGILPLDEELNQVAFEEEEDDEDEVEGELPSGFSDIGDSGGDDPL